VNELAIPSSKIISIPFFHIPYRLLKPKNSLLIVLKHFLNILDIYLLGLVAALFIAKKHDILILNMHCASNLLLGLCRLKTIYVVCDCPQAHPVYVESIYLDAPTRFQLGSLKKPGLLISNEILGINHSNFIVCPSDFVRDTLISSNPCLANSQSIKIIPYGFTSFKHSLIPKCDDLLPSSFTDEDSILILFIGTLSYRKGISLLLEAFLSASKVTSNLKLIIGGPKEIDIDAEYLNSSDASNIIYLGKLNATQVASLMIKSSVFILPTLCEGQALVLGECLSLGLPFFTTIASGFPVEYISHIYNPLMFDGIPDSNKIHSFLLDLSIKREYLIQLKTTLINNLSASYSWSDYGQSYVDLVRRLSR